MSRRLKKHQDRLAVVRKAQTALLELAEKEDRDLSAEEVATFDGYNAEAAELEASIKREQAVLDWEKTLEPERRQEQERTTETTEQKPKFANLGEQVRAVIRAERTHVMDERLVPMAGTATGHGEDDSTLGGYLVQKEFMVQLMQRTYQRAVLADRCYNHPVGANFNGVKIPHIDETSRATGSRYGGVRAYWRAEGGSVTAFTARLGQQTLDLVDMMAITYVTNELAQDATSLGAFIMENVPAEMAFKLDDAILNGTGAGQPKGIIADTATVSVAKETGQAATTIKYENILKMWTRMWAPSRASAVWVINQDCEVQLNSMSMTVGTGGVPVYLPAGGLSTSPYATLMGRPVIPIEQASTLGTVGDICLCDFNEYMLITKGGVRQDSSMHVQFLTNEETLRWTYRCNGMPKWKAALTPFKGSNTLSPFITLATRS